MEKQKLRLMRVKRKHILARLLLSLAAVVILLPVVLTALYSFFSPNEIKAFMQTRGSFDAASLMEIKLSPNMFSLSQYYKILIEDMTILRYFVNSAMYTAAILFGQALLIPAMAYAALPFQISRAGRAVLRRDHADASAVSGDDGAQRHHAARDGAAGHDLGDHSADDGRRRFTSFCCGSTWLACLVR